MKICLSCGLRHQVADYSCPACGWSPSKHMGFVSFASKTVAEEVRFKPEFFIQLVSTERSHFWFRSRNRLLAWALKTYFPYAQSLLEIGCGTGFVLLGLRNAFPDLRLTGSDVLYEGLEFAKRIPDVTLLHMDARQIPFEKEFDVVAAFDLLEHIEDDQAVLRQMYQATNPNGGIIVTVPQHPCLWSDFDVFSGHCRRYVHKQLKAKVERAGFHVIRITSFVSFPLSLMLLVRKLKRKEVDDMMTELRINALLNACLEKILWFERLLIRAGLFLPTGASLLMIARKR